jgi:hypothetical protein
MGVTLWNRNGAGMATRGRGQGTGSRGSQGPCPRAISLVGTGGGRRGKHMTKGKHKMNGGLQSHHTNQEAGSQEPRAPPSTMRREEQGPSSRKCIATPRSPVWVPGSRLAGDQDPWLPSLKGARCTGNRTSDSA